MRRSLWPKVSLGYHELEMTQLLSGHGYTAYVLDRGDGRLGGFAEVSIRPYANGCESRPVGYLEGWYVDQDLRHRGVGKRLVAEGERWAGGQGCREFASDCLLDNATSETAHKAMGFEEVERLICFRKPLGR